MLKINKTIENNTLTVVLIGKMDSVTTPQAASEINEDIDKVNALVLDFSDLDFISSAGLRLIVTLHKKMANRGGMKLINVNDANMEIFQFTGFLAFLNIE